MNIEDKCRIEDEYDSEEFEWESDGYDSDDSFEDDCLYPMPLQRNLHASIKKDDNDKFVFLLNSQLEKPKIVPINVLDTIITYRAKNCALALFNGETDQEVNINSLIPPTGLSLLHFAIRWRWFVDYLLQRHNAPTNLRCDIVGDIRDQMNPLNFALDITGDSHLVADSTSSKPSIFKIIIRHCLPYYESLKSIRSLYWSTKDVEEEIFYYASQGKLLELTALLMVDREKVMSPSFFQKLHPSFFQRQNDSSSLRGSMSLRNFIISKLASVAAMKVKPGYDCQSHNFSRMHKEEEAILMSTLLLLEVFDRAGEAIEAYCRLDRTCMQDEQVVKEVACLLQQAGFTLTYEDIDLRYPRRSLSMRDFSFVPQTIKCQLDLIQAENLLLCGRFHGQKGEKELPSKYVSKNGDMANSKMGSPYAKWRMASARHILESTKFLFESLKTPAMISHSSNEALLGALELLRHHPCLRNWTLENSIFELLCKLCWPELGETLETIRLAACNTMEIGTVSCHYINEGRLVELAALLMVAREKLMVGNTSQNGNGCSYGGRMVRQLIMHEIQNLIDEEIRSLGRTPIGESTQRCEDRKAVMLSALQLVEVFESYGHVIDRYRQSKRYGEITKEELAEDVAWLLKKTGFCLKRRECSLVDLKFFSKNMGMGNEQSENVDMQRDIGMPLGSQMYTFPLAEKIPPSAMRSGPMGMSLLSSQYASTRFCSAIRSYHSFQSSQSNIGPKSKSSLSVRNEVGLTTKKVKSQISLFSLDKRWPFVVLAINRRVKCV